MNKNMVTFEGLEITSMQANKLNKIALERKEFDQIDEAYDHEVCFRLKDNRLVFMTTRGRIYSFNVETKQQETIEFKESKKEEVKKEMSLDDEVAELLARFK